MNIIKPEFNIGQLVRHRLFHYRGVIFDIDPEFAGTEEWYRQMAKSRPPKDAPWYHVLPDNATHTTYVAERNLLGDEDNLPVNHPLISRFFKGFSGHHYILQDRVN